MRATYFFAFASVAVLAGAGILVSACSSDVRKNGFDDPDAAVSTDGGLGGNLGDTAPPCTGLECKQVACSGGKTTTIKGTVYSPAKNNPDPIYNAILYVPNAPLEPFKEGVSCEQCGTVTSGSPLVTALSGSDGTFTIENVPAGDDIPLVIQVGRWRRQVTIPKVKACEENDLDADLTRLPRSSQEGDIPLMAIVTSTYDKTECLMRKIGIDDSEFTPGNGSGRIHIFHGNGSTMSGAQQGTSLWNDPAELAKYDIVALPCSSQPTDMTGRQNIVSYANSGGRVFITDLSQDVIKEGPEPWPSTANWETGFSSFTNPASIDTTFPKGEALADWLKNVGASSTLGKIELEDTYVRLTTVGTGAQRWVYGDNNVQTYSFNTPVGEAEQNQCGRVFYSSFHVTSSFGGAGDVPQSCGSDTALAPQEKALEFMLFDLAACIIKDGEKPIPPPVK